MAFRNAHFIVLARSANAAALALIRLANTAALFLPVRPTPHALALIHLANAASQLPYGSGKTIGELQLRSQVERKAARKMRRRFSSECKEIPVDRRRQLLSHFVN